MSLSLSELIKISFNNKFLYIVQTQKRVSQHHSCQFPTRKNSDNQNQIAKYKLIYFYTYLQDINLGNPVKFRRTQI